MLLSWLHETAIWIDRVGYVQPVLQDFDVKCVLIGAQSMHLNIVHFCGVLTAFSRIIKFMSSFFSGLPIPQSGAGPTLTHQFCTYLVIIVDGDAICDHNYVTNSTFQDFEDLVTYKPWGKPAGGAPKVRKPLGNFTKLSDCFIT